jgi:hypothetical protein
VRDAERLEVGLLRFAGPRTEPSGSAAPADRRSRASGSHGFARHLRRQQDRQGTGRELSVFKYVETLYSPVRLHQTLGYKSPDQFEAEYAPVLAA